MTEQNSTTSQPERQGNTVAGKRYTPYAELLRHPNWQRKRLEVLEREGFKCEMCGDGESMLHVHHTYYEKGLKPWEYPDTSLKAVCARCHEIAQEMLCDLHRQIGRLDVFAVDQMYGYAIGIELCGQFRAHKEAKLTIYSPQFADGLGAALGLGGQFIFGWLMNSRNEVSVDRLLYYAANQSIAPEREPEE